MTEPKSPESQIRDAAWTYGGWFVLLTLTLLAGLALGYLFWGDAITLRAEVADLTQKVSGARAERENVQTQLTMTGEELRRCQAKVSAAAPANP